MTKIYLIRHGESEWNRTFKIQGQQNPSLTELGKEQARKLGDRLINENIDIIYTSDLARAYETASIISDKTNIPIVKSKEIREINFGIWEGLSIKEIQEKYGEEYLVWMTEPEKFQLKGAETLESLRNRVMGFVDKLINENQNKNIVIVSHSTTLKVIILNLLGMGNSYYKNFSLKNVSVSIVESRKYNNVLTLLNDISHLKELY